MIHVGNLAFSLQRAQAIEDTAARRQNGFSRDVSTAAGYRRGGTKGDQRAETLGSYLPDAVLSYGGALCVGEGDGGIQQDVVGDGGVFGIRQFDVLDMGAGLLLEGVRGSLFKGRLERTSSCIRPPTSCTSWSVGGCWPRELLTRCSAAPTFERRYQGKLGDTAGLHVDHGGVP